MAQEIVATAEEISAAFTEWDKRFRADPESFASEAARLLKETPEDYGAACTPYFISILSDLKQQ